MEQPQWKQNSQLAQNYWAKELQNMLGIQNGSMSPTELPEYKSMASQYNTQSNQAMNRAVQTMGQRGITGGAAAGVINNAENGNQQNLLKMIQGMYGNSLQRGGNAANALMDYDKMRRQIQAMMALNWSKQHEARQGQGTAIEGIVKGLMAAMQNMGGSGGGGGGAGASNAMGGMGNYGMDWGSAWSDPSFGGSFANGGTIEEPVIGQGLQSGQTYTFGEEGIPETVIPHKTSNNGMWDALRSMLADNMNQPVKQKNSEEAGNAQSITQGIAGIAKLIASYYTGNYGLAKSGGQDLMGALSTQMED